MKNTKKNKRLVDKNFKHKKFLIVIIIFAAWFVLGSINAVYKNKNIAQKVDIFEVKVNNVNNEVTVKGHLRFDPLSNTGSNYTLVLTDGSTIAIDQSSKAFNSKLLDRFVTISGTLIPLPETIYRGLLIPVKMSGE